MNNESKRRVIIAQELADYLKSKQHSPAQSFIVYGSSILGTAQANSDIDIILLVDYNDRQLMSELKKKTLEIQKIHAVLITINVKLVSDFLKEITEGNHYFLHIALKGKCLLDSKIFEGFKSIVATNSLPSQKDLISKNAKDTSSRVQDLFLGSLVKLCTGIRITILKYIDLKLLQTMNLESWEEYQTQIQRDVYEPSIRKFLPQYADNIMAFFALSDQVKPLGFDLAVLDKLPSCNFVELLRCIEFITKDSQTTLQD